MEQYFIRNYSLIALPFAFPFSTPTHLLSHPHTPSIINAYERARSFRNKEWFCPLSRE